MSRSRFAATRVHHATEAGELGAIGFSVGHALFQRGAFLGECLLPGCQELHLGQERVGGISVIECGHSTGEVALLGGIALDAAIEVGKLALQATILAALGDLALDDAGIGEDAAHSLPHQRIDDAGGDTESRPAARTGIPGRTHTYFGLDVDADAVGLPTISTRPQCPHRIYPVREGSLPGTCCAGWR